MSSRLNSTKALVDTLIFSSQQKVHKPFLKVFLMAIMAGAFIAFGAEGSSAASYFLPTTGLTKTIAGIVFPIGLMMIVIVGGQLFTSNCMNVMAAFDKKLTWIVVMKNIGIVYLGNFVGAILIAWAISLSGEFNYSTGELGGYTIKLAIGKLSLEFTTALVSGILCNILVCIAVVMAAASKDVTGKILAIFFPIFLFIISGFEHSIANMYYIPAGIMAALNPEYVQKAIDVYHVDPQELQLLSYGNMVLKNLVPVTIGNIIGGMLVSIFLYVIAKDKKQIKN